MASRAQLQDAIQRANAASDYEAAQYLSEQLQAAQPPTAEQLRQQDWDSMSGIEQALVGAGETTEQLLQGIGFGTTSEEDLRRSQQMESPYKTGGKIAADIAMLAVPAAKVAKGASMLPKARAALLAGAGGEAALTGAYEGAKLPQEGQTRMGNAGEAAAWSAGLNAIGPAVRGAARMRQTPEAREMLKQGIPLTPGAADKSNLAPYLESKMVDVPWVGGGIKRQQDAAQDAWNISVLNKITPENVTVTKPGFEGFKQAQEGFTKNYNAVWNSVTPKNINFGPKDKMAAELDEFLNVKQLAPDDARQLTALKNHAIEELHRFKQVGDTSILDELDGILRNSVPEDNKLAAKLTEKLRERIRSTLPRKTSKALQKVDRKWVDYKTVENAANRVKAQERGGTLTPRDLQTGIKNRSTPGQAVSGRGNLQELANAAEKTLAKVTPERSQINVSGGIAPWATGAALYADSGLTASALGLGRLATGEGMRKTLTGTPMSPEELMAQILRAGRIGTATNRND